MNNKKGFTLVEIIVSVILLALIGLIIGFSLNRSIKSQKEKSYQEFVEKVKESALLYANNTKEIINDLNNNSSFKILKIEELINNGYLNENLIDPSINEKVNKEDLLKIYYNENYELLVDYPYNKTKEVYLYVSNYSAIYKSNEENLCYKGLNGPTLQLVDDLGNKSIDLVENVSIKAYFEDGQPCDNNKLNTNKIGTYKIKYEYTKDGSSLSESENKYISERTIIVAPGKPIIDKFIIDYQIPINSNNFDSTKATMTLKIKDKSNTELKYCIVPFRATESIEISKLFLNCKDKINSNNIGGYWMNYSTNNNEELTINYDLNNFDDIRNMEDIKFYVFAKNGMEEYNSKSNESNNKIYKFKRQVILNAGESNVKNDKKAKFSDGRFRAIILTKYGISFKDFINDSNNIKYKNPIISDNSTEQGKYKFEGWKNISNNDVYSNESTFRITDNIELTAVWYKYCSSTKLTNTGSCDAACGTNGKKTKYYVDAKYTNYSCPSSTETCYGGDCPPPSGGGGGDGSDCPVRAECVGSRDCDPAGSCCWWNVWYDC